MSRLHLSRCALSACVAAIFLAGCSQNNSTALQPISGSLPMRLGQPRSESAQSPPKELFVSNGSSYNVVDVFSIPGYRKTGAITNGVSSALGLWVDKTGNLYAANSSGKNVTEYAPGSHSLICSYNVPEGQPQYVVTNDQAFVYVTSTKVINQFNIQGYVYEFQQCGSQIRRYDAAAPVAGVALDADGNIFVRLTQTSQYRGGLEEFKRGQSRPTPLVKLKGGGGLVIDKNKKLIASDGIHYIYVISPPYKSATRLAPISSSIGLSLNGSERLLFSATHFIFYHYHSYVQINSYPSGSFVGNVDTKEAATGAAVSPDATF